MTTTISSALRQLVIQRAASQCEFCLATANLLRFNLPVRMDVRQLLIERGRYPRS